MSQQLSPSPPKKGFPKLVLLVGICAIVLGSIAVYTIVIRQIGINTYATWKTLVYAGNRSERTWTTPSFEITGEKWRVRLDVNGLPPTEKMQITVRKALNYQVVTTMQLQNGVEYELTYKDTFTLTVDMSQGPSVDFWYLTIEDFTTH